MGHDEHFLSRLDRVNRTEMDFALSLYRDHKLVRWVLDRARVPEGTDRIAIAISDDKNPAHLIVARDGGFVTCLAPGMSIGDRPRVVRRELDRLVDESREFRERWAQMQIDGSFKWISPTLDRWPAYRTRGLSALRTDRADRRSDVRPTLLHRGRLASQSAENHHR